MPESTPGSNAAGRHSTTGDLDSPTLIQSPGQTIEETVDDSTQPNYHNIQLPASLHSANNNGLPTKGPSVNSGTPSAEQISTATTGTTLVSQHNDTDQSNSGIAEASSHDTSLPNDKEDAKEGVNIIIIYYLYNHEVYRQIIGYEMRVGA